METRSNWLLTWKARAFPAIDEWLTESRSRSTVAFQTHQAARMGVVTSHTHTHR